MDGWMDGWMDGYSVGIAANDAAWWFNDNTGGASLIMLLMLYRAPLTSKRWQRSLPNRRATLQRRAGYSMMMYSIIRNSSDTLAV